MITELTALQALRLVTNSAVFEKLTTRKLISNTRHYKKYPIDMDLIIYRKETKGDRSFFSKSTNVAVNNYYTVLLGKKLFSKRYP